MASKQITGHYALLAGVKRGDYPDGRTKLSKTINYFRQLLRKPYGENWNDKQEAREALAVPLMYFHFSMPMVNEQLKLLDDYKWTYAALERLITKLAEDSDKDNAKGAKLDDYLKKVYCEQK